MQTEAIVVEILSENYARVCMHARGECEKCGVKESCAMDKEKKIKETIAINTIEAKQGDSVLLEMNPWRVVFSAFLVYIFPLIILILGYSLGNQLFAEEKIAIILGLTGLVLSFFILKALNNSFAKNDNYKPMIIKILD